VEDIGLVGIVEEDIGVGIEQEDTAGEDIAGEGIVEGDIAEVGIVVVGIVEEGIVGEDIAEPEADHIQGRVEW